MQVKLEFDDLAGLLEYINNQSSMLDGDMNMLNGASRHGHLKITLVMEIVE